MAHTPLFEQLIHAFRVAGESVTTGKPVDAILEQQARDQMSRGDFLGASAVPEVTLTGLPTRPGSAPRPMSYDLKAKGHER